MVARWSARVKARTSDVFEAMAADLDSVDRRLIEAARVDYPLISPLVEGLVNTGGKRLRPLLLLLAAKGFTYDLDRAVTAAAGVELLHTASLVHDDNIDRAALRRGVPTLNTQLSAGAVILIGDYLFAQSAILAAATESTRVVAIFASTLGDICDGQLRETLDAHRLTQDLDDYEKRIYGKSAALFAGAAEMGAVIGQAPESAVQQLRAFGREIGMAFQVIDDVLDLREGTQILGKPAGNDLRQGVVTLPVMLFTQRIPPKSPQMQTLEAVVSGDETNDTVIDELISTIRQSGVLEECETRATYYTDQARHRINVVPDEETRDFLFDTLDLAVVRSS
jgi:geranylgeranyl pyrophosphate synthase